MLSQPRLKGVAVTALLVATASCSTECSTIYEQFRDSSVIGSIGSSIESSIAGGNSNIILGRKIEGCGHESSAIWKIWAQALELNSPSTISHILESGKVEDRVCVDKTILAKLTVAASTCFEHVSGGGSSDSESSDSTDGSIWKGILDEKSLDGLFGGKKDGHGGGSSGGGSKTIGDSTTTSSSSGSKSTSTWGHGNVNTENICFKIKDKRTDRYLTTGGTEYAWAYHANYYSVFRAMPSRKVENGYTMTEINRNGIKVNYPVKLDSGMGQFKPLYGEKDAIWSFSPAVFGDSCWGVPGKEMSRRHDWGGGWGDNYRQVSSGGDDCADVEIEEADC